MRSKVVEGASDSPFHFRRRKFDAARAPSTTLRSLRSLRAVPRPRDRGGGRQSPPVLAARFCSRPSFVARQEEAPPEQIKREAERRKARSQPPRRTRGCRHPGMHADKFTQSAQTVCCAARATNDSLARTTRFGRARLPALHRGSRRRANADDSVQAALHAERRTQALPAPLFALKPSTWLAGHNAGGDDTRTARVRSVSLRPREPHSLPSVSTLGRKVPLDS